MKENYQVIFCIVNAGFTDAAMDFAREAGAKGGTIMHARGTANLGAEKMFGITVQPEKEIVMIIVEDSVRDDVMHALYRGVGQKTEAQGIAFCMPVDGVAGLGQSPAKPAVQVAEAETQTAEQPEQK